MTCGRSRRPHRTRHYSALRTTPRRRRAKNGATGRRVVEVEPTPAAQGPGVTGTAAPKELNPARPRRPAATYDVRPEPETAPDPSLLGATDDAPAAPRAAPPERL